MCMYSRSSATDLPVMGFSSLLHTTTNARSSCCCVHACVTVRVMPRATLVCALRRRTRHACLCGAACACRLCARARYMCACALHVCVCVLCMHVCKKRDVHCPLRESNSHTQRASSLCVACACAYFTSAQILGRRHRRCAYAAVCGVLLFPEICTHSHDEACKG
jgi:hypothetical protein